MRRDSMTTKSTKYSHQREAIIKYLESTTNHPTADEVYQHMREIIPNISLGTVYRNLSQMAASGRILRLTADGKTDHFDACTSTHYHFMCKSCGCVRDIPIAPLDSLVEDAKKVSEHVVEDVSIMFSGTCKDCLIKSVDD